MSVKGFDPKQILSFLYPRRLTPCLLSKIFSFGRGGILNLVSKHSIVCLLWHNSLWSLYTSQQVLTGESIVHNCFFIFLWFL